MNRYFEKPGKGRKIGWKKILCITALLLLAMLSFSSCKQEEIPEQPEASKSVIVTFLYVSEVPEDLGKVQEAVNEITTSKIGVEIQFKPLSLEESLTDYSLWINSGEQIDLMCFLAQDIMQYVTAGDLLSMESYISNTDTPSIVSLNEEFGIENTLNGHIYGLSTIPANSGWQPGIIIREDWLKETEYEEKELYTLEDITGIFKQIKENHPEQYAYAPLAIGLSNASSWASSLVELMIAGNGVLSGCLESAESTTVVNYFDTEAYRLYLKTLAEWHQAGYIMEEAATMDVSLGDLMKSSQVASFSNNQEPNQFGSELYGFSLTGLPTAEAMFSGGGGISWGIPKTSKNPKEAVQFLELLYSDQGLCNLIMRGIEGEHWVMVSEKDGFIDYPDGVDATNTSYRNHYGVWGDMRQIYNFNHSVTREKNEEFTKKAQENTYQNVGFTYEENNVSDQILACQAVLKKYQRALETGALEEEWEEVYRKMLLELDTAGIQEIIEDTQKQLDTFLIEKETDSSKKP